MGKPTAFLEIARQKQPSRPIAERLHDWRETTMAFDPVAMRAQASRCMNCGIPFCHQGCPLGNLIPDWNDFAYRDRWAAVYEQLRATNNFPEFTGALCPAPCEGSCVLGINNLPVTIKATEADIIERAFDAGLVTVQGPERRTGKRVAVVGSGPAGLAVADQLNRAGHLVTVFERADRIGGLLRYGIPEFKLEKRRLDRRLLVMAGEGVTFRTNCHIGRNMSVDELKAEFDAIVLAGGSTVPRDLKVPGRELGGIHFAIEYLSQANRRCEGDTVPEAQAITAQGKHVVIIGGGDTGADCLGTAHRQGAASVHQLELLAQPPDERAANNPWPLWPNIFRVSSAHEEGGERLYSIATDRFEGTTKGRVSVLHASRVEMVKTERGVAFQPIAGTAFEIKADLVLLAMGFVGPEQGGLLDTLGVRMTERGTVWRNEQWMTSVPGVFVTGDMQRGQSLVVWAIADGRSAALGVDTYLMGDSALPAPVR